MVQRVVIDSNMLQTPTLRAYLAGARDNVAVLPDFVWIEMYKQQSVSGVAAAFSVIGDFPGSLIVLKSGHEVASIDPRHPDLIERMFRADVANDVRRMTEAISLAARGEPSVITQLADQWSRAAAQMSGMLVGAGDIIESLPEIADIFSSDEVRRCRTNDRYTPAMFEKIFGAADQIYETLAEGHGAASGYLLSEYRYDAYLYRYALAIIIYALWWIKNGSQAPKRLDKARNDIIDLSFAVYGTYFAGLMTDDAKARWMHDNLSAALKSLGAGVGPAPLERT